MKKENEADIPIFSLAFGRGADFDIVKRVAAQNNGFARKIYEDSDAALQIAGFYKEISTVLLKDVKFNYVDGTLYDTEVTNTELKLISGVQKWLFLEKSKISKNYSQD